MTFKLINSHSIGAWLSERPFYLKSPLYMACEDHTWEHFWVSFDASMGLHKATDFPLTSFESSRQACFSYLRSACQLLGRNIPQWSPDHEGRRRILKELGPPPLNAYTIYMMTVSDLKTNDERIVYIGKTNSNSHRFRGGHAAISKLHSPEYDGMCKKIYFGCIVGFNDDEDHIPIDWLLPATGRDTTLSDIELQLIWHVQPELNDYGRKECKARERISIHIQNFCSKVLDGVIFD
ncbi:MAG: hypothetical protein ACE37J_17265 [Pikeienuella sp.]|uniref:hypothetical protein n=1 Tax=Pikeienuella sp. TaxID=2831957 RepID=UPI00391A8D0A